MNVAGDRFLMKEAYCSGVWVRDRISCGRFLGMTVVTGFAGVPLK